MKILVCGDREWGEKMAEKNRIIWFALRCSDEDVTNALIKAQEIFGDDIRIVALRPVDEEERKLIEETCKPERTLSKEDVARPRRSHRQLDDYVCPEQATSITEVVT